MAPFLIGIRRRLGALILGLFCGVPAVFGCISSSATPFSAVTENSLAFHWTTVCSTGTVYFTQLSTTPAFTVLVASQVVVDSSSDTFGSPPLKADTSYFARVTTTNFTGGGVIVSASTATLAATPAAGSPSIDLVTPQGFTMHWTSGTFAGFNPADTLYRAEVSSTAFLTIQFSSQVAALSVQATGLTGNTTYFARVKAINRNGVPTGFANLGFTATLPANSSQAQTFASGPLQLDVPADTFSQNYSIQFNTVPLSQPVASPAIPAAILEANQKIAGNGNDDRRQPVAGSLVEIVAKDSGQNLLETSTSKTYTLTMAFQATNGTLIVNGRIVRASTLAIYRLDESTRRWIKIPTSAVDLAQGVVTATVSELGVFALMGQLDTSLVDAFAFPVPFSPSRGHSGITFTNLSQTGKIRIFTAGGRLVATLEESGEDGELFWDVRNADGERLAPGVYIYLLTSATDEKKGKLMILP